MKIFGKSISEYFRFQKVILWLIVIVGSGGWPFLWAAFPTRAQSG